MAKASRTKLRKTIRPGGLVAPDASIDHTVVGSATRTRYKRQGFIYKDDLGVIRLTRFGAETLGWVPAKPGPIRRFFQAVGLSA